MWPVNLSPQSFPSEQSSLLVGAECIYCPDFKGTQRRKMGKNKELWHCLWGEIGPCCTVILNSSLFPQYKANLHAERSCDLVLHPRKCHGYSTHILYRGARTHGKMERSHSSTLKTVSYKQFCLCHEIQKKTLIWGTLYIYNFKLLFKWVDKKYLQSTQYMF